MSDRRCVKVTPHGPHEWVDVALRQDCPGIAAWPAVMVTGHRRLASTSWVEEELNRLAVKLRDRHETRTAVCGMALGADMAWGEAALTAGLDLAPHIPFPQQPDRWPTSEQARWEYLRSHACTDEVVYGDHYSVRLLHARNDGMIAAADACIAVWDGRREGGTWSAIRKAVAAGLPTIHVDPAHRRTTLPSPAAWRHMLNERCHA